MKIQSLVTCPHVVKNLKTNKDIFDQILDFCPFQILSI